MAQDLRKPLVEATAEEDAARAVASRYRLEYVDVASFAPDPDILQSVPADLMFRYNFLPYRREGARLVLVMADPTDIPVVDELSLLLTPVADGRPGEPALFDVEGESAARAVARLRLKSVRRAAADMLWIRYAVRNGRGR